MKHHFVGVFPNQNITLITDETSFLEANSVLIFAFYKGQLIFTRHRTRGWEIPGGSRESREWEIQAAMRELYEETGAEISAIETVGQYSIYEDAQLTVVKTVFIAKVKEIHPLPEGFETSAIRLYKFSPTIEEIADDSQFSPLVKDEVYPRIMEIIHKHPYAERMTYD